MSNPRKLATAHLFGGAHRLADDGPLEKVERMVHTGVKGMVHAHLLAGDGPLGVEEVEEGLEPWIRAPQVHVLVELEGHLQ